MPGGATHRLALVLIREAEPADVEACAQICFDGFASIHDGHNFPRDFAGLGATTMVITAQIGSPGVFGVVAEIDGNIIGSNFIDERDPIMAIGPITVAPSGQNSGVGRRLMEAVLERAKDARGIRLVQDGFHMRSLALYSSLGFEVTAACVLVEGTPGGDPPAGTEVRPVTEADVEECAALCEQVHGFERSALLRGTVDVNMARCAVRENRIVAYATAPSAWHMNHGVAESDADLQALLLGAGAEGPLAFLAPMRSPLFPWCLEQGLRAVKPMNVMSRGEYREPRGAWFPSVSY